MTLAFGPGEWNNQITFWNSTAANTVTNTGTMPIPLSTSFAPAGFTNAGTVDQASARVTIVEGGSITNTGTWKLTDNSDMWGFAGGAGEHFVNSGTLDKATGAGTAFIGTNNVRVDNTGTVRATTGTLDLLAGTWPATILQAATDAVLDIQFDTTSTPSGLFDVTGGGTTIWRGAITPTGPMTLAFGPGEWNNQITFWNSTAANTVTNTAMMPIPLSTSFAPAGFTNAGTVDQASARVTILEGGSITNTGTWKLTDNSDMWGFAGGTGEHFVNSGTLDKATGAGTAFIGTNNVRVDNTGTVRATTGTLDLLAGAWPGTVIDSAAAGSSTSSSTPRPSCRVSTT